MHGFGQPSRSAVGSVTTSAKKDEPLFEDAPREASDNRSGDVLLLSDGRTVSTAEVQDVLLRALNSPEFQSAPQLRVFLAFVVDAALNNQTDKIKGYTIAVEALGRPEDFNPVTDPIVRVEAARLRRRLSRYYSGTGKSDPVRIVIPKGSYAPTFEAPPAGPATDRQLHQMASEESHTERSPLSEPTPVRKIEALTPTPMIISTGSNASQMTGAGSSTAVPTIKTEPLSEAGNDSPALFGAKLLNVKLSLPVVAILALIFALLGYLAGLNQVNF